MSAGEAILRGVIIGLLIAAFIIVFGGMFLSLYTLSSWGIVVFFFAGCLQELRNKLFKK